MNITKLLNRACDSINYDVNLQEVLDFIVKNKIKYCILLKDEKPVGIITEKDILLAYTQHSNIKVKALEFANTNLFTSKENRELNYILGLMLNNNIRKIIITNEDDLYVGTILQETLIYKFEENIFKSNIKAKELIKSSNKALVSNKDSSIQDCLEIMSKDDSGSILIFNNSNEAIGILTQSDIITLAQKHVNTNQAIKTFIHLDLIFFDSEDFLIDILRIIKEKQIRRAVIFDKKENEYFVITSKDILRNIQGNYSIFLESKLKDIKNTFNSLNEAVIELYDDGKEQIIYWFNNKAKNLFNLSIDKDITTIIPKDRWNYIYKNIQENNFDKSDFIEINENTFQLTIIETKLLNATLIKLLFTNITEIIDKNKQIEHKFIETFEQDSIGILHISLENKIIDANKKIVQMLGYKKDELIGKNILNLTYHEDIDKTLEHINNLFKGKFISHSFEKRCVKKDNSIIWFNVTSSISTKNNDKQYLICFILDITDQIELKEKLIESNKKFKLLYEEVPFPYQSLDKNGIIKSVNKKWLEITGYEREEVIGEKFTDFSPDNSEIIKKEFKEFLEVNFCKNKQIRIRKKNNKIILADFTGQISKEDGEISAYCVFKDITEEVIINRKLNLSNIVFENTTEAIIITDEKNKIISTNNSFSKITGYSFEEVKNKNPKMLNSGHHSKTFYIDLWKDLLENNFWEGEIWNRKKNGEIYPEWLNISIVRDLNGNITNYVALFSDITKIKSSTNKIEFLAHHDSLTSLPNRLLLNARLNKSIEKCNLEQSRLAVFFIDIDNFKLINDTHGHSLGDKVIKSVAQRLKKNIRKNDTLARIGGDEFIIVIEDIFEEKNIENIACKILNDFEELIKIEKHIFDITISIGISIFPNNGLNAEDLIKHADTAMYSAKNAGKNQFHFYESKMTSEIFEKIIMKKEIKEAIKNDEFEVYYQPQIDIKSNKIVGAEALVRWNHKKLGLVSPLNFIPHAEENRLIIPLGEVILEKACSFMKKLHELNILNEGKIAVNISGVQIKHSDIIKTIQEKLELTKLDPSFLEVEVTESYIMEDIKNSLIILKNLKDLGIKLSIDDFGTGYSSLNYLKQFPIDKLKIDKSFINELPDNSKDVAIAKTVIALTKGLGIKSIAEGVEINSQKDFLAQEECDEIQGWVYSKALKEDDFVNYVKEFQ